MMIRPFQGYHPRTRCRFHPLPLRRTPHGQTHADGYAGYLCLSFLPSLHLPHCPEYRPTPSSITGQPSHQQYPKSTVPPHFLHRQTAPQNPSFYAVRRACFRVWLRFLSPIFEPRCQTTVGYKACARMLRHRGAACRSSGRLDFCRLLGGGI